MLNYTTEEEVQTIKWYYSGKSTADIQELFCKAFENRPVPDAQIVSDIVQKFETTGCVDHCKLCVRNDEPKARKVSKKQKRKESEICGLTEENQTHSSKQISENMAIEPEPIANISHKDETDETVLTQEIGAEERKKRLKFCNAVLKRIDADENFIRNILFTGESFFTLDGHHHNFTEARYWAKGTKCVKVSTASENPNQPKLYVWVGILNDSIIGPIFIDGHLNSEKYLLILQNNIIPSVRSIGVNLDEVWLQQDGLPAHSAKSVKSFLKTTFGKRVISKDGPISWPPGSGDLSPNSFFTFGYIKQKIYNNTSGRPSSLEELKSKIIETFKDLTPEMLADVRQEFHNRIEKCKARNGQYFENTK